MEKPSYYDHLESIKAHFPGKEMITLPEVCKFLPADRRTLLGDKSFPVKIVGKHYFVSVINLARWMA